MSTMDRAIDHVLTSAQARHVNAEVLAVEKASTGISMANRNLDQFSFSETHEIGVRVVKGHNEGLAYSENLSPESLDQMLDDALANADMIEKDMTADLRARAELPQYDFLLKPGHRSFPADKKVQAATELEAAAFDFDKRIDNVSYCKFGDSWVRHHIANTEGLRGQFEAGGCYAYIGCLVKDGGNFVRASEQAYNRDLTKFNAAAVGRAAAEKALSRLGAKRPKTGKYSVVFDNRVAEDLVSMLGAYFSAKAVDEKSSPLEGRLGQDVFSKDFTLIDDPSHKIGLASRPFDDEGYASKKITLVEQGHLTSFLTNSLYAKKMKLPHTAHGSRSPQSELDISPSNLVVQPGTSSQKDLLSAHSQSVLITDILGSAGFRETSGDFSLPVEGFLFENGKMISPLKDFLISGNLIDLFRSIDGVGSDVLSPVGNVMSPSLRIPNMDIAGES